MSQVIIYTTHYCPYCVRAKQLLKHKGVAFTEIAVDTDPHLRQEMEKKSGRRTVPQIFINHVAIGGFDELYALETQGKLDALLSQH
jgi:glutaredoxin 3